MKRRGLTRSRASALAAVVVLVATAAACGRSDDEGSGTTASAAAAVTSAEAATTVAAPGGTDATAETATTVASDAAAAAAKCGSEPLQATDVGVTPTDITVFVMADTGSPLAPGLFQGAIDAVTAWGKTINDEGGLACRKIVVKPWDSKITPDDAVNGTLAACTTSFAMLGTSSLFLEDASAMATCKDKAGAATGIPEIPAIPTAVAHQCNPTSFPIGASAGECPYSGKGPRKSDQFTGQYQYFLKQNPGLHGLYLVPSDTPSTYQSSVPGFRAAQQLGIKSDGEFSVFGSDQQASYGRFATIMKQKGSTFLADNADDKGMVRMRKEANAQGVNTVKVWACSSACYTPNFLQQGGKEVDDTYFYLQYLPFEDGAANATLQKFLTAIGGPAKASSFAAGAWSAADEFEAVVNKIVAADGPNALTRAKFLDTIKDFNGFDDGGFMAPKDQHGTSDCMVLMQVKDGKFVRVLPTEAGKFDCNPAYLTPMNIDPSSKLVG